MKSNAWDTARAAPGAAADAQGVRPQRTSPRSWTTFKTFTAVAIQSALSKR